MAALLERESNGSGAGFKVNEIRSATDDDFQHFMRLVEEYKTEGSGWTKKLERRDITIWQKETGQSSIKMALVSGAGTIDIVFEWEFSIHGLFCPFVQIIGKFEGVSPDTVFDAILDGGYRRTWDDNVIEDYEICRLDDNNDVGYYSSK